MSSPFQGTYPTGGIPAKGTDIPVSSVLLVVYLGLGIVHAIFFFKLSKKTFIPGAMVMGFCFSRVVTMCLRIAWTANVTIKNLAIAANVFVNGGVLLIYVINLIFLHRYILQIFPSIPTNGKHLFNLIAHAYMLSVVPLLVLVIAPGVQLFLTTDPDIIVTDRTILRFAQCYLTVFVAVQVATVVVVWVYYFLKSRKASGMSGKEVTIRASIIFFVGSLLLWIQAIKTRQTFYTPTPQTPHNPPWFLQRPILYAGLFLPEILCVLIYSVTNIRLRFLKPVRDGKIVEDPEAEGHGNPTDGRAVVHEKIDQA